MTDKSIHDLLADKGNVLDTGSVIFPGPRAADRGTSEVHSLSTTQYLDADGNVHAVLIDKVTTTGADGTTTTTLEILADVVI